MRSVFLGLLFGMVQTLFAPGASAADPSTFEVMGLKLGMTVSETQKVSKQAGFTITGRDPGPSFEQAVAQKHGKRISGTAYSGVNKISLARDDARAEVFFAPTPEGSRAYQIAVDVLMVSDGGDLAADIIEIYGQPEQRSQREWLWGDTGMFYARTKPYLEFQPSPVSATSPKPIGRLILANPALQKHTQDAVANEAKREN